jgi:hypothetical protein
MVPRTVQGAPLLKEPPRMTPEELKKYEEALRKSHVPIIVPVDPEVRPETIIPTSPETLPTHLPEPDEVNVPLAPGTFTFYRVHPLTLAETSNPSSTNEPSLGVNGRVVFWTGNWYASISDDRGQSFSFLNPANNFGPDPNGGFCCDQIAYYERTRGAMFWLLQYTNDGVTNTQRIAVANSQAMVRSNTWFVNDFTPASFGLPATGVWLDFPDLSVSNNFLYLTTNVFTIAANPVYQGTVMARFPLTELSQGVGYTYSYNVVDVALRATHGATSTMYFGGHEDTSTLRVYRWAENSGTIYSETIDHNAYNLGCPTGCDAVMSAPSPDGTDFAANGDNRILGAYFDTIGALGFMWHAAQGDGFPYPHVWIVQVRVSDWELIYEEQIWSNSIAWMYPSVHVNDRGHPGGTIAFGGGADYPGAAAWIADDFNAATIVPLENLVFATGDSGPAPPPNRTIYVDWTNTGSEDGTPEHPYNTVTEGHDAAIPGDTIIIRTGNYPETVTLSTETTIYNEGGQVIIGE